MQTAPATATQGDQSLEVLLRPIHRAWLDEARRYLVPVLEPSADFWTRWTAVRYVADQFHARYRQERELVDELRPYLDPEEADRLQHSADGLRQLRLELDRIGRRRGTGKEAAPVAAALLGYLERWCAEVETAANGLVPEELPAEARELLAHLDASLPGLP